MAYELCKISTVIALQNDEFRSCLGEPSKTNIRGVVHLTKSVTSLSDEEQAEIWSDVAGYKTFLFNEDTDPWQERDYGRIKGRNDSDYYWKFDYFANSDFEDGSPNPADLNCTYRVLTIAAVEDY